MLWFVMDSPLFGTTPTFISHFEQGQFTFVQTIQSLKIDHVLSSMSFSQQIWFKKQIKNFTHNPSEVVKTGKYLVHHDQ